MQYFISFLEGIITFISPCLLPMLPVYLLYLAGGEEKRNDTALKNSVGFVTGFSLVFILLGAFAGTIGSVLKSYAMIVNIISGSVVILFGLSFLGVFHNLFMNGISSEKIKISGFFSSMLFGIIFSVSWTPCVGAFLGSALMLASNRGSVTEGILMLLFYSIGLGIPFIISAVIIDKLKTAFDFIKKHYKVINLISGLLLIAVGILMMTGMIGILLSVLTFW